MFQLPSDQQKHPQGYTLWSRVHRLQYEEDTQGEKKRYLITGLLTPEDRISPDPEELEPVTLTIPYLRTVPCILAQSPDRLVKLQEDNYFDFV